MLRPGSRPGAGAGGLSRCGKFGLRVGFAGRDGRFSRLLAH
jgi:hypothetical protein